jgi:hypothetical protein
MFAVAMEEGLMGARGIMADLDRHVRAPVGRRVRWVTTTVGVAALSIGHVRNGSVWN